MERATLTCDKGTISIEDLPKAVRKNRDTVLQETAVPAAELDLASQEQALLLAALEKCAWNQSNAARELGITRSALRYRLQKYGLKR